jgi:predicted nucleic acid-binding Zn ribbon protein
MPIYEYEHLEKPCQKSRRFEVNQSMSDLKKTIKD